MPRLWVTKSPLKKSDNGSEDCVYTPSIKIIKPELYLPNSIYTCKSLDYNDISYLSALASSGALSLGTSAGTDRSISEEFGGSVPHALSEYYGAASGVPSSGTIDFSDFHGKSGGCNPPVTNCLWTHYDFSGCSVGSLDAACTTSAAAEQQCLRAGYLSTNTRVWNNRSAQICTLTSNGISNNYWLACDYCSFRTCDGDAFWGTGSTDINGRGVDNTVFLVWQSDGSGADNSYYHMIRWNSGYNGYRLTYYNTYHYPFYSGHLWQTYRPTFYDYYYCFWLYGSDSLAFGSYHKFGGTSGDLETANDSHIVGHRVDVSGTSPAYGLRTFATYKMQFINDSQSQTTPSICCYQPNTRYWSRVYQQNAGGYDFFNGHFSYYAITNNNSRVAECFAIGEYLHFKCTLTDTEWNDTFTYLKNKWSVNGGTGSY